MTTGRAALLPVPIRAVPVEVYFDPIPKFRSKVFRRGVTIPQKEDSDSRGLQPKSLNEPAPGESDLNFLISQIGKNKTPTTGELRAKRLNE